MENTYLLELIKTLTLEEREELIRFIHSPYFNRGKQAAVLPALLTVILAALPDLAGGVLDKTAIYHLVFPGQDVVEGKLKKAMAGANKLVRTFLLVRRYFDEDNAFSKRSTSQASCANADSRADCGWIAKLEKYQSGQKRRAAPHYYRQFLLEFEIHEWQSTFNQTKGDFNLPPDQSLDLFILSTGSNC